MCVLQIRTKWTYMASRNETEVKKKNAVQSHVEFGNPSREPILDNVWGILWVYSLSIKLRWKNMGKY